MKTGHFFSAIVAIFLTLCSPIIAANPPPQEDLSLEQNIATLGGDPTSMVDGCVNAITGTFVETAHDLFTPGFDSLVVERLYTSSNGWSIDDVECVEFYDTSDHIVSHQEKGMTTVYSKQKDDLKIRPNSYKHGLTNCAQAYIGGKSNPHNMRMKVKPSLLLAEKSATLKNGAGSLKKFSTSFIAAPNLVEKRYLSGIEFEQKPSGIRTVYNHQKSPLGWKVQDITQVNSLSQILGSIKFDYSQFPHSSSMIAYANNHLSGNCQYHFFGQAPHRYLYQVNPSSAPTTQYLYYPQTDRMQKKILPQGRIKKIDYYDETNPTAPLKQKDFTSLSDEKRRHYGRVSHLWAPVGTDQTLYPTHTFSYEIRMKGGSVLEGGITRVKNIHQDETHYHYDKFSRLREIDDCHGSQVYRRKGFFWSPVPDLEGCLITKTLAQAHGDLYSCRYYEYDKNGNIAADWLLGNLSGMGSNPTINEYGIPTGHGDEKHIQTYKYSDDGFNHLLYEFDGRKEIFYVYYSQLDLLHKKFISTNGEVKYREFYSYNVNGSPTRVVSDDGNSREENDLTKVSERHILCISYREQFPIGLPQIIEEKYLDLNTRQEILIKKTENVHDNYGRIVQQHHYDSQAQYLYTLYWEYDAHGNLLKETNPLGHASLYQYDENDNCIFEQHPGDFFYTVHEYDFSDRLICSKDVHPHQVLSTHYSYNGLNQKVSMTNWNGQTTKYEYDDFGRVIKTIYPSVANLEGQFYCPFESYAYDIADNITSKTDRRGHKTNISYNIRGKPTVIQHPDGGIETKEYTLDGYLKKETALNGTVTQIDCDYLGRPWRKTLFSSSGEPLHETKTHYNHFHKISEIDPAGQQTLYLYDGAGRLVAIIKNESKTLYQYDTCQRVKKILEYYGPEEKDYIATVKDYDLMDRVIEERTEDANGQVLTKTGYAYNERGERIQLLSYRDSIPDITTFSYHAYGEVEKIVDPQGNVTRVLFHYNHVNACGQNVFVKETIDPMGQSLWQEYDPLNRLQLEMRKDSMGNICQKREFFYDAGDRCCRHVEHVIVSGETQRHVIAHFEYDFSGNLTSCTEAFGSIEQKITRHFYNPYRQKYATLKPDGVTLSYAYDSLGRLSQFSSSDSSFSYCYHYDKNSNIIRVDDLCHHTATQRLFDHNNRMIQETLSNGLTQKYAYDALGRTIQQTLPDESTIGYVYASKNLHQIQRGNHVHTYTKYNLTGLLEEAEMADTLGKIEYKYDPLQRLTAIKTSKWKEEIPDEGFDAAGNLLKKVTHDISGEIQSTYRYDALYQLQFEKNSEEHTYQHDSVYNLVQKDQSFHQINSLHQIVHDGKDKHIYDPNGNLKQKGDLHLSYDALDRLITVEMVNQKIIYAYDETSRRVSKTRYTKDTNDQWVSTQTLRYLYQGENEIGACDESGKILELRVLGLGKGAEIGAAVLMELNGETYVPIHDTSGNVRALLDVKTEDIAESYQYTAYGQEKIYDNDLINPWRFSSKRTDEETHFVYFGKRYYNPETTRWITADPLGFEAGPNPYAYVMNRPLVRLDLRGLQDSNPSRWERQRERSIMYGEGRPSRVGYARTRRSDGSEENKLPKVKEAYDYEDKYCIHYQRSGHYTLAGKKLEGCRIALVNGIDNTLEEAIETAMYLQKLSGGYEIDILYNATHNIVNDIKECAIGLLGTATISVVKDYLTKYGKDNKILLFAHSQGNIHTNNALMCCDQKVKDQVTLVGIAPASYAHPSACKEVYYYCVQLPHDFIPYIDIPGRMRRKNDITTLKSHPNSPWFDHAFTSPTYEEVIQTHTIDFLKKQRVYHE